MKAGVYLRGGIGRVDNAPRCELEIMLERFGNQRGLIDLVELHVGADLLPELLKDLTSHAAARRRRDHHLERYWLAVLFEQFLGLSRVVRESTDIRAFDE